MADPRGSDVDWADGLDRLIQATRNLPSSLRDAVLDYARYAIEYAAELSAAGRIGRDPALRHRLPLAAGLYRLLTIVRAQRRMLTWTLTEGERRGVHGIALGSQVIRADDSIAVSLNRLERDVAEVLRQVTGLEHEPHSLFQVIEAVSDK